MWSPEDLVRSTNPGIAGWVGLSLDQLELLLYNCTMSILGVDELLKCLETDKCIQNYCSLQYSRSCSIGDNGYSRHKNLSPDMYKGPIPRTDIRARGCQARSFEELSFFRSNSSAQICSKTFSHPMKKKQGLPFSIAKYEEARYPFCC